MKSLVLSASFLASMLFFSFSASSLELLSNESLDKISGRAVSVEQADSTEIFFPFNLFDADEPELNSFSQGNSDVNSTVFIDFLGFDTPDGFGNTYHQRFYSDFSAQNIMYSNLFNGRPEGSDPYGDIRDNFAKDTYSFVIFQGAAIGMTFVPEYFDNNPELTSKTLKISKNKIDLPAGLTGNYLCSYQGNLFYADDLSDLDESFLIFPNRQTITTGTAKNGDLTFLLPRGEGDRTVWKPVVKNTDPITGDIEYLVIPEGEKYIHISLNSSETRMDMRFKISLSNIKRSALTENTELNLQTLGTFTMVGGKTTMNNGNVIITTNDTL